MNETSVETAAQNHLCSSSSHAAERRESLKAGLLSAVVTGFVFAGTVTVNHWVFAPLFPGLWVLQMQSLNLAGLGSGILAVVTGALFGITYRYIVRTDANPHLRSGAVMVFSVTRGCAQIDIGWLTDGLLWPFVILAIESFFLFAVARVILDQVLWKGWIQPFSS